MLPHEIVSKDDILGEGAQTGRGLRIPGPEPVGKAIFKAQRWVLAGLDTEGTLAPPPWVKSLPLELKPVPQPFCRGRQIG